MPLFSQSVTANKNSEHDPPLRFIKADKLLQQDLREKATYLLETLMIHHLHLKIKCFEGHHDFFQ